MTDMEKQVIDSYVKEEVGAANEAREAVLDKLTTIEMVIDCARQSIALLKDEDENDPDTDGHLKLAHEAFLRLSAESRELADAAMEARWHMANASKFQTR